MPHLPSNILSTISSGSIFSELFGIVRCSLRYYFIPRDSDLLSMEMRRKVEIEHKVEIEQHHLNN